MKVRERERTVRAMQECLRYVQRDAEKAGLSLVSLHISLAIAETEATLAELIQQDGEAESDTDQTVRRA